MRKYRKRCMMRILGVDPGTAIVGYSIVDYEKGKYEI